MLRRVALILVITGAFSGAMYTTIGCGGYGGSPTLPTPPVEVHGTVTNAITGGAVASATVALIQGSTIFQLTTPADGRFSFSARSVGEARLEARASGYNNYTQTITLVAGSSENNIRLQPAP